jgi:hypothetical protein
VLFTMAPALVAALAKTHAVRNWLLYAEALEKPAERPSNPAMAPTSRRRLAPAARLRQSPSEAGGIAALSASSSYKFDHRDRSRTADRGVLRRAIPALQTSTQTIRFDAAGAARHYDLEQGHGCGPGAANRAVTRVVRSARLVSAASCKP